MCLLQVQIFFCLQASIALKFDDDVKRDATNMDVLLTVSTLVPLAVACYMESPLRPIVNHVGSRVETDVATATRRSVATVESSFSRRLSYISTDGSKQRKSSVAERRGSSLVRRDSLIPGRASKALDDYAARTLGRSSTSCPSRRSSRRSSAICQQRSWLDRHVTDIENEDEKEYMQPPI